MKITVVNELKKYYDVHKVADRLKGEEFVPEPFTPLVEKTMTQYVKSGDKVGLNKFLLKWNAPKTQFTDWTPFNPFEEKINKPNKDFDNPF